LYPDKCLPLKLEDIDMDYSEYFLNAKDGIKLFVRKWKPENPIRAVIYLLHGFSEHSGRYEQWAKKFTEENFCVYALDYRGHGQAEGARGHTPSYKYLMDDVKVFLSHNQEDKAYPKILYGQSLGGNLALHYSLFNNHELSGIIATSPWLKLSVKPKSIHVLLTRIARIIAPKITQNSSFDMNVLSHDPQVAIDYEKDPLTHSRITTQLFFGAEKAARRVLKNAANISIPLLLMHGTSDLVTSFSASKKFAQEAKNFQKDVTFITWDEYYHELHNEINNQVVFEEILKWIHLKILKNK
jgi:alpha-beta hydrolase superfamily lysophospholipase